MKKVKHYVYIYLDPRKPGKYEYFDQGIGISFDYEPFYIGEGKNNRLNAHLTEAKNDNFENIDGGNKYKIRKIRKIWEVGFQPIIYKIFEFENEQDALSFERTLGFLIGRCNQKRGPLTNLVDCGGKTTNPSKETLNKILFKRKKTYNDNPNLLIEQGRKLSLFLKENPQIIINRIEKYKETLKENPYINVNKGIKIHENHLANPHIKKEGAKKRIENEEENPEIKKQRIKSYKETLKNNPDISLNKGKKIKETKQNDPEGRAKAGQKISIIRQNETPEQRQKRTDNLYLFYKNNPDKKKQETEKANKTKKETRELKNKCIMIIKNFNLPIEYILGKRSREYWKEMERLIKVCLDQ